MCSLVMTAAVEVDVITEVEVVVVEATMEATKMVIMVSTRADTSIGSLPSRKMPSRSPRSRLLLGRRRSGSLILWGSHLAMSRSLKMMKARRRF
jgi:hypothetical protein